MQLTKFAFAIGLWSSIATAHLAARLTIAAPNPDSVAEQAYCQCVGTARPDDAIPDDLPNKEVSVTACNAYSGILFDVDGFPQCQGIDPTAVSGIAAFCASYGVIGAKGARCCTGGQAYKDCDVVIAGPNEQ
ncbi:hypothetical protein CB0940_06608 [Cercospora beticola]|uniref:Hydrophobin n=1 Tax=Cercospora beticola TaxID=122368 RepID=A0A2G5I1E0_CERBT|nr:hypothetical protein CB0940_06608 [Cercospora beticola]PIA98343.1 hypothetical protein CB0940_06608 [Cercospora beticola]WPA99258.1 hypothetical protein RHO25_003875 [Cercospora beticola]CAK1360575.1 unnamed protein product [Cercospora beticola]